MHSRLAAPLRPLLLLRPTSQSLLKPTNPFLRLYSSSDTSMTPAELSIASLLSSSTSPLSPTTSLLVRDVSGGCGSMYAIDVSTPKFRGLSLLQQQRLVTKTLGEKVKEWHGVQIRTSVPAEGES